MEEFRSFLESSTVHGVSYLATTRKFARVFWLSVVTASFIIASLLIREAFKAWTDNPISTTIETKTISEIRFPKVTICPPKDTLTDLNEVLIRIGNKTFDYDTINESTIGYQVLEKFTTFFQNEDFKRRLSKVGSFYENERYKKWYEWDSSAKFPSEKWEDSTLMGIITIATSGVVSTPYFKEKLDFNRYEQLKTYYVDIQSPYSEGATLLLNLEYDVLEENYECLKVGVQTRQSCLNSEENFKQIKIEVKGSEVTKVSFERKTLLSKTSMTEILKKRDFTGFRVSWNVTTDETTNKQLYPWYKEKHNHVFIGFANLAQELNKSQHTQFWEVLRYIYTGCPKKTAL